MRRSLVSLQCHPDAEPADPLWAGEGYDVVVNRTPGYADAVRWAVREAVDRRVDLVLADADGYHPAKEVLRLVRTQWDAGVIKPWRTSLVLQSRAFSALYSLSRGRWLEDATGGLYRLAYGFMAQMPELRARDMTVHVEVLDAALAGGFPVLQYPYRPGRNGAASHRSEWYRLSLLGRLQR